MKAVFTAVPDTVLGRRVPDEFKRRCVRLQDPVSVLASFIRWIESAEPQQPATPPPPPPAPDAAGALAAAREASSRAEADRAALIELCADMHDRLTSNGHREKVRRGLREAGVELVEPEEEPFDVDRHEAVGTLPTDDPALDDHVAATQRVGYVDRGRLVREPGVLVYRYESATDG